MEVGMASNSLPLPNVFLLSVILMTPNSQQEALTNCLPHGSQLQEPVRSTFRTTEPHRRVGAMGWRPSLEVSKWKGGEQVASVVGRCRGSVTTRCLYSRTGPLGAIRQVLHSGGPRGRDTPMWELFSLFGFWVWTDLAAAAFWSRWTLSGFSCHRAQGWRPAHFLFMSLPLPPGCRHLGVSIWFLPSVLLLL